MSKASEEAIKRLRDMGVTMYRTCGSARPGFPEQQCELREGHGGEHQAEVRTNVMWTSNAEEKK